MSALELHFSPDLLNVMAGALSPSGGLVTLHLGGGHVAVFYEGVQFVDEQRQSEAYRLEFEGDQIALYAWLDNDWSQVYGEQQ